MSKAKNAPASAVVAVTKQGIELTMNHSVYNGLPTRSLQMKQVVVEKVSLQGSGKEEFGYTNILNAGAKEFENKKTLVLFNAVPKDMSNLSDEEIINNVKASLDKNINMKLQERRSLFPYQTQAQSYAISQGSTTINDIADKQLVINPSTGEPALYKAEDGSMHKQYRVVFLGDKSLDTRPQDFKTLVEQAQQFTL